MRAGETTLRICGVVVLGLVLTGVSVRPEGRVQGGMTSQPPRATPPSVAQEKEPWTTYRNENYNFSLKYPARKWSLYQGEDGNGVRLTLRDKSKFRLPPEMGGGGHVGQPTGADDHCCVTLEEDFESCLDALREYGRTEDLMVLSKERVRIQGLPAIETTIRYKNSSGEVWFEKLILIHTMDDRITYDLGLDCSPDDLPVLMPVFNELVRTFRILGPPR